LSSCLLATLQIIHELILIMKNKFILIVVAIVLSFAPKGVFGQAPDLGVASTFALFTAAGAFNGDPATSVVGDIGTNVGAFTPPGFLVGNIHVADPVSAQAAADVAIAYSQLAGLTCAQVLATPFGNNQTLTPKIYCIGSAAVLNANLTLDGGGNPGAIFIFQINGALSTNSLSNILLTNGASLCNVYWQVNGAFNHNGQLFQGTVIAAGAINLGTGARLNGRGLSTMGAISTSANIVTLPSACLCDLTVTCPNPSGGTFQCPSNIPVGLPSDVTVNTSCGTPTVTITQTSTGAGCVNSPFVLTRTYLVTDQGGHSTTCVVTYTAIDQNAPTITCPAAATAQCTSQVPAVSLTAPTASDNCGGAVTISFVSDVITNQTCANRYTITRTYRATDACGNSAICAQTITVFDNTVPTITCPAPVTVQCASLVPAVNTASPTATDNCGGAVTITFVSDVITNQTCADRFTVTRTYRATDACGNSATCPQIITVFDNTPPVFINPPANVTVECFLIPPVPPNPTASDNCAGAVTVIFLGEIQSPGVCPVVYTLTRTWRATDVCGNSSTVSQVVTVIDTYAPQFIENALDVILECDLTTNQDSFQNWLNNQGGALVNDCSTVTWTFMDSPFFLMPSTCGGTSQRFIRFIATDECGNSAFQDAGFTIVDLTPPTFTILPQNLNLECWTGEEGDAFLPEFLENFEVSDDCGEVFTQVVFISQTEGCGNTFRRVYEFRATDECGNTNYVTATFAMVDSLPPVIVSCPEGNVLLTCEYDIPAPDTAGVVAWDNCGTVKITVESIFSVGVGCGYWPMTKSYTYAATDECGNVSYCYQSFQVVDTIPPVYTGPDTIYVLCVDDLPGLGEVADIITPLVIDNCYNVICVYEGVDSTGVNSVTFCIKVKDLCVNWSDKFIVTFIATGGCKPLCTAPQTTWGNTAGMINGMSTTEAIQQLINKNGPVTAGKLGKTIEVSSSTCMQNMLSIGGHTSQLGHGNFEFGAFNDCLTSSSLLNTDGTLKNKLVSNVLAMQLNIWYNREFNDRDLGVQALSSIPLCLIDPVVMSKLEENHFSVQGLLNLSNDYLAGVGFFLPGFGNLINEALDQVNNYWRNCQTNDPCATSILVAGSLKTESQDGLEEGRVRLDGSYNASPLPNQYEYSNAAGFYEFSNAIPYSSNYRVIPTSENKGHLNGVTTYDLVLLSKHILGIEPLSSPYKMIAADANRSGSITTFDIVELRKLILGLYEELPQNTAWRFVDKSYVFPTPENPFFPDFPEYRTVGQELQNEQDFVSIKIGDLNNSAQANNLMPITDRAVGVLLFDLDDRVVTPGEIFEVKMTADQKVQCFQFTLNTAALEVLEISGEGMSEANFAVFAAAGQSFGKTGALTTSWNLSEGTTAEIASFTLKCRATQSGRLRDMLGISSRFTRAEAYLNNDKVAARPLDVALRFHDEGTASISGLGFELYPNVPNPFVDKTTIAFNLPEAAQATLTVYDETGRLVFRQKGDFAKGYNFFVLEGQLVHTNGILLYKVETATDMATGKMIQTK